MYSNFYRCTPKTVTTYNDHKDTQKHQKMEHKMDPLYLSPLSPHGHMKHSLPIVTEAWSSLSVAQYPRKSPPMLRLQGYQCSKSMPLVNSAKVIICTRFILNKLLTQFTRLHCTCIT